MDDKVIPEGKWQFNGKVANCFDDMLKRSIPQIDVMRQAVTDLAKLYIKPNTDILDLGCSRGDAIAPLIEAGYFSNRFYGLEVSEPMRQIATNRFKGQDGVKILDHDLRQSLEGLEGIRPSVCLSILTLQFVPIEYRQKLISDIYDRLQKGGAFVLVEKILGETSEINEKLINLYYASKKSNGYSDEDIKRKRLSLEGVLVPVTASWNEELLAKAGFKQIDCFWRWMNFAGWIAIK